MLDFSYSIVGDDNAPTYFEIDETGTIKVKSELRNAPGNEIDYSVSIIIFVKKSSVIVFVLCAISHMYG